MLLNHFINSNSFSPVDIPHTTYHHFIGNGLYDRIFHSQHLVSPEQLSKIYCKLVNPLIESHHDILISTLSLPQYRYQDNSKKDNITAPRVRNNRTRIVWSEQGIADYQALVVPRLLLIQQTWLNKPNPSNSIISSVLKSQLLQQSFKLGEHIQPIKRAQNSVQFCGQ